MIATYLIGFLFAFSGLPRYFEGIRGERLPRWCASASVVVLVLSFVAALCVDWFVAVGFPGGIPEARDGPFAYVDFVRVDTGPKVGTIEECLALLQVVASCVFLLSAPKKGLGRRLGILCCAAVAVFGAVALLVPYVGSSDVYAYIAQAVSEPSGYDPGIYVHPERLWPVFTVWGNPTLPSPYGPLWLWTTGEVVRLGGGVWGSVVLLRVLGVLSLGTCVWSLQRLGVDDRVCWLLFLCPEVWRLYVLDVHNDLVPTALVMAAAAVVFRVPVLSVVLVACATAVKLPFALLCFPAFSSRTSRSLRFGLPLLGGLLGVVGSFVVAGDAYPYAILRTGAAYRHSGSWLESDFHLVLVVLAVLGILALSFDRRVRFGASFCVVAVSQFASEQYLAWGLPFVSASSAALAAYLCLMPLAGFLLSFTYAVTPFSFAVRLVVVCLLAGACAMRGLRTAKRQGAFWAPGTSRNR